MDIISIKFILLVIGAVFTYFLLNNRYRSLFLAVISSGFIASYSYLLLLYILAYTLINYGLGIKLEQVEKKKLIFRVGVVFNILQLVVLKYASFAIDPFIGLLDSNIEVSVISKIIIPIGVSYFTLQAIGYLINIKMGWEKSERNFVDFLVYITFFPKFLSGPVERSNHFLPQLKKAKSFNEGQIVDGLRTALIGCFKKVAIANQLYPLISSAYVDVNSADGSLLWTVLLIQPLYLYFDFSGYTDIAIGIAKMFGINLLPNFNRPFFAENVSTFWRRFHMSLSLWFGDYIFKQTMFRRRKWGTFASVYALLLSWILFGIWHGAGWNFMVLGVLQAAVVIYEFFTKRWRMKLFSRVSNKTRVWIGRFLTYWFYGVSLVFFFAPDLSEALRYFSGLSEWNGLQIGANQKAVLFVTSVFIALFMFFELLKNDYAQIAERIELFWSTKKLTFRIMRWSLYFFLMAVVIILNNDVQNFIYFNF